MTSPKFTLTTANIPSIVKSALIVIFALGSIMVLKSLFPSFDFIQYQTAILTGVGTFLTNLVKEYLEEKK